MRLIFLIVSILLCTLVLQAERNSADSLFIRAVNLQKEGRQDEAADLYLHILEDGHQSTELYANLGAAFEGLGAIGQAVWSYENCMRLSSATGPCLDRLERLREEINSYQTPFRSFILYRFVFSGSVLFTPVVWAGLSLVFGWILAIFIFRRKWKGRRFGAIMLSALLLLSLLFGGVAAHEKFRADLAIVKKDMLPLRAAPDLDSESLYSVQAGSKVEMMAEYEGWVQVKLPNRDIAWVPSSDLIKLTDRPM